MAFPSLDFDQRAVLIALRVIADRIERDEKKCEKILEMIGKTEGAR